MLRTVATAALVLAAASLVAEDSPLVALAKRTNRQASKVPVITNDTVAHSGGRISVAGSSEAPKTANATATPQAQPAAKQTAEAAKTEEPVAAPSTTAYVAPTPSKTTKDAAAVAPIYSTGRTIEPQITARNIDAQSTLRMSDASSTIHTTSPDSTVQSYVPQTTVRNIDPQVAQPPQ